MDNKTRRIVIDRPLPGFFASLHLISETEVEVMGMKVKRFVYEFPTVGALERVMGIRTMTGMTMGGVR